MKLNLSYGNYAQAQTTVFLRPHLCNVEARAEPQPLLKMATMENDLKSLPPPPTALKRTHTAREAMICHNLSKLIVFYASSQ